MTCAADRVAPRHLTYPERVRRLLTLRWLGRHVAAVLLVLAFLALGRWQLGRGLAQQGTLQNFGYAAEWWLLSGIVVYGWGRLCLDELRPDRRERREVRDAHREDAQEASRTDGQAWVEPRPAGGARAETDPELAAYNDYLARLNANPRR